MPRPNFLVSVIANNINWPSLADLMAIASFYQQHSSRLESRPVAIDDGGP
jgi:hypothetical protein